MANNRTVSPRSQTRSRTSQGPQQSMLCGRMITTRSKPGCTNSPLPGLAPGIHVFRTMILNDRRGWRDKPGMTREAVQTHSSYLLPNDAHVLERWLTRRRCRRRRGFRARPDRAGGGRSTRSPRARGRAAASMTITRSERTPPRRCCGSQKTTSCARTADVLQIDLQFARVSARGRQNGSSQKERRVMNGAADRHALTHATGELPDAWSRTRRARRTR